MSGRVHEQTASSVWAYVGLGGNLDQPETRLAAALEALRLSGDATRVSALWGSAPWGPVPQPDYVNQVLGLRTTLSAPALLEVLRALEVRLGRRRADEVRWGPRVVDLDLLLHGETVLDTPTLQVPHPRIAVRRFVLAPLCELAPDLCPPGLGRSVRALLQSCLDSGAVWPLGPSHVSPAPLEGVAS
jgi:2-amino-4-hydroxy-6-hydroxymethyldihydropteridine diphosphokinase